MGLFCPRLEITGAQAKPLLLFALGSGDCCVPAASFGCRTTCGRLARARVGPGSAALIPLRALAPEFGCSWTHRDRRALSRPRVPVLAPRPRVPAGARWGLSPPCSRHAGPDGEPGGVGAGAPHLQPLGLRGLRADAAGLHGHRALPRPLQGRPEDLGGFLHGRPADGGGAGGALALGQLHVGHPGAGGAGRGVPLRLQVPLDVPGAAAQHPAHRPPLPARLLPPGAHQHLRVPGAALQQARAALRHRAVHSGHGAVHGDRHLRPRPDPQPSDRLGHLGVAALHRSHLHLLHHHSACGAGVPGGPGGSLGVLGAGAHRGSLGRRAG